MNIFSRIFRFIRSYIKEVRFELKKVTWPGRKETLRYTLIVIGMSLTVAVFLGGLDFVFKYVLELFIF